MGFYTFISGDDASLRVGPNGQGVVLLTIAQCAFDIGVAEGMGKEGFVLHIAAEINHAIATGAQIILLPEYLFGGLAGFFKGSERTQLIATADYVWNEGLPLLRSKLSSSDCFVVCGSTPFHDVATGMLTNRAPVLNDGSLQWVDKLYLTPWESAFVPGVDFKVLEFKSDGEVCRICPVICLDIEIPRTAVMLHQAQPDIVLVAAATESELGVERIDRCASARAVECGAAVFTAHLRCPSHQGTDMFSGHCGGVGSYLPAQSTCLNKDRVWRSPTADHQHFWRFESLDLSALRKQKYQTKETNPALVRS